MSPLLSLEDLLFLAGMLHFLNVPAMLLAPRMLGWREDLAKLAPINRRMVLVMGGGIVLVILGLGTVVAVCSREMAEGGRLGMALSCFLGIFWGYRTFIQVYVYPRIWPGGFLGRLSHFGLVALFPFLSGVYWLAFFSGLL
ncbi:MAG: hypothetical protein HY402_01440 [Elusimicrobia bacterium]|nr:hypothetical protein [Elusimicrobiota bacterium]